MLNEKLKKKVCNEVGRFLLQQNQRVFVLVTSVIKVTNKTISNFLNNNREKSTKIMIYKLF